MRRRIERSAPLDKSRTMSDWNQRPLEAKELYYAALDAYATRAVAVECMHMVLGEASAIPIKERIKAFENEKGRTMEREMDEKRTLRNERRILFVTSSDLAFWRARRIKTSTARFAAVLNCENCILMLSLFIRAKHRFSICMRWKPNR